LRGKDGKKKKTPKPKKKGGSPSFQMGPAKKPWPTGKGCVRKKKSGANLNQKIRGKLVGTKEKKKKRLCEGSQREFP